MNNTTRQTIGLTQPHCDYYGCITEPTHTDGEFVMCPRHEKTAYSTTTYWRPITRMAAQPGDLWPYYLAEY
ncbi:hypothetical protein [Rhodococcus artemisiae]|uniref:Uncharacterized protein n=1 Tax=Rhodococcus artemisiae TaxID=714159 RepID=A0ABU7LJG0_9NOCA|nr:hypothetical protein [Rhodococcus artemisiae]MEE2061688.1 hypothetical protein [Rhodococcus artemisiae]